MKKNARKNEMMAKHPKTDGMCHLSEKMHKDGTSQKPKLSSPETVTLSGLIPLLYCHLLRI